MVDLLVRQTAVGVGLPGEWSLAQPARGGPDGAVWLSLYQLSRRHRAGPPELESRSRKLPESEVFREICSVLFHTVPPHSWECCRPGCLVGPPRLDLGLGAPLMWRE